MKLFCILALTWLGWEPAFAQVNFHVAFENLGAGTNSTTANLGEALRSHAIAAAQSWTRWLAIDGPRSIEILIRIAPTATGRGDGASQTSSFVRRDGAVNVFEQGLAAELRTGVDPNGSTADVIFTLGPDYLRNQLWFDPDPLSRSATPPSNRIDAFSFFAHEFGHALVFNGWHDTATGKLPGDYASTYDTLSRYDGTNWWFRGATVLGLYGGELPLSRINNTVPHYGNPPGGAAPGTEAALVDGLMNGVVFRYGQRYAVGLLELAVARDAGLTLVPAVEFGAPQATLTMASGGAGWKLSWTATPLSRYRVDAVSQLTGAWVRQSVQSYPDFVSGPMEYTEGGSTPTRFYRVRRTL